VLVSQVVPVGQQDPQRGPGQATVPAGHKSREPAVSQVRGSVAPVQRHASGLAAVVGQQAASAASQTPLTQVHVPAEQTALTWQRLPQLPQLRGSLLVSTQSPPQQGPAAHTAPSALGRHFPFLHRFLPCLLWQSPRLHFSHAPHFGLHLPDLARVDPRRK